MSRRSPAKTYNPKIYGQRQPSQRGLRIGEDIRHRLAQILIRRETHIQELDQSPITLSEVSVSADLSKARIYVMTLGGTDIDRVVAVLNEYAPILRHQTAQQIHLRRMPAFIFVRDDSFEQADRMNKLFSTINSDK